MSDLSKLCNSIWAAGLIKYKSDVVWYFKPDSSLVDAYGVNCNSFIVDNTDATPQVTCWRQVVATPRLDRVENVAERNATSHNVATQQHATDDHPGRRDGESLQTASNTV